MEFVARLKNIFDLDSDPMAIENSLKEDKKLKPFLKKYQGLRIPGTWDGFELAVRAVVGQKISVIVIDKTGGYEKRGFPLKGNQEII